MGLKRLGSLCLMIYDVRLRVVWFRISDWRVTVSNGCACLDGEVYIGVEGEGSMLWGSWVLKA